MANNTTKKQTSLSTLEFGNFNAYYICSAALYDLAENDNRSEIAQYTIDSAWLDTLLSAIEKNKESSFFTDIKLDTLDNLDGDDLNKRPINKLYIERHKSILFKCLDKLPLNTQDLDSPEIHLRIFENGALSVCGYLRSINVNNDFETAKAISVVNTGRELIHKELKNVILEFTEYWNTILPDLKCTFDPKRDFLKFEKYEYIDFQVNSPSSNKPAVIKPGSISSKLEHYRSLVGFCRMSNTESRENFMSQYITEFMQNDVGGREDELWLAYSERFVRYYPRHKANGGKIYGEFIILILEHFLSQRAVFKNMIEEVRDRISKIPQNFYGSNKNVKLDYIQNELFKLSLRLSKCRFPSDIQFYAGTAFADRLLKHIEIVMDLGMLSNCLETENNKLKNLTDSNASVLMHKDSINAQTQMKIITIVGVFIATVGVFIALSIGGYFSFEASPFFREKMTSNSALPNQENISIKSNQKNILEKTKKN